MPVIRVAPAPVEATVAPMTDVSPLSIVRLSGDDLEPALDDVARLRIEVFREWPYCYQGSLDYERSYLRTYMQSAGAVCVLALDGNQVVGASTAVPLSDETEEVLRPFEQAGIPPDEVFYFGESVLRRDYRGRGVGVRFFDEREAAARAHGGITWCAFCAVVRDETDPRRPPDYQPLDRFWQRRGFFPRPDMRTTFSWLEVGADRETEQAMSFWLKRLDGPDGVG